MRDYKKHLTLLPHKWQVIGLVVFAVVFAYEWVQDTLLKQFDGNLWYAYLEIVTWVLGCASILVACLSQEKTEDEYVTSVRYRALTISVIIFLVARAITEVIGWQFHRYTIIPTATMMGSRGDGFMLWNYPVFDSILTVTQYFRSVTELEIIYILLVKILKRIGSGTGYASLLLPYKYKKTGWILLGVTVVLMPAAIIVNKYVNVLCWYGKMEWLVILYLIACLLLTLLEYVGVFLVCLSKQQQEDEFIRHIRVRLLVFFVIAYAIVDFADVLNNAGRAIHRVVSEPDPSSGYFLYSVVSRKILMWLRWIPGVALVYSLVLKMVLSKNLKESSNEE